MGGDVVPKPRGTGGVDGEVAKLEADRDLLAPAPRTSSVHCFGVHSASNVELLAAPACQSAQLERRALAPSAVRLKGERHDEHRPAARSRRVIA